MFFTPLLLLLLPRQNCRLLLAAESDYNVRFVFQPVATWRQTAALKLHCALVRAAWSLSRLIKRKIVTLISVPALPPPAIGSFLLSRSCEEICHFANLITRLNSVRLVAARRGSYLEEKKKQYNELIGICEEKWNLSTILHFDIPGPGRGDK